MSPRGGFFLFHNWVHRVIHCSTLFKQCAPSLNLLDYPVASNFSFTLVTKFFYMWARRGCSLFIIIVFLSIYLFIIRYDNKSKLFYLNKLFLFDHSSFEACYTYVVPYMEFCYNL